MLWKLARKELLFDRMMSCCQIAAIACILAPLLLLFSLRHGILQEMELRLKNDPQVLSLSLDTSYRLDDTFFKNLQALPEVGYVIPEITALNALVDLKFPGTVERVSVMATSKGDPIVVGSGISLHDDRDTLHNNECYITEQLAKEHNIAAGNKVTMVVTRVKQGVRQVARIPLKVQGIVLQRFVNDDFLLVNPQVVRALDDYRNGYEPEIFSDGSNVPTGPRYYAKFRLYATDLDSVIPLFYFLANQHFNVRSKVQEIENLQAIDRVLNFVFGVVAVVSIVGGAIALGGLMLSSLKSKKRNLVLLRLMGQSNSNTYRLVILESCIIAVLGFVLALVLYYLGSLVFNLYFKQLMMDAVISELLWWHIAIFLLVTVAIAVLIALWATKFVMLKAHIADVLREA